MPITRCHYLFLLMAILSHVIASGVQAQTKSNFEGFFSDFSVGYRNSNTSTSSSLTLNGTVIPSTLSTGQLSNSISVFSAGYNFAIAPSYILGIGANISPASGQAQPVQAQALNQTISLTGIKPLYNYGFFLTPGFEIGDGLAYLKLGTQTQVNNSNTSPNFYGYLFGLGYKQKIFQSIYLFGEADYAVFSAQTSVKTVSTSGNSINASVTTKPQGNRFLLGLGYQF